MNRYNVTRRAWNIYLRLVSSNKLFYSNMSEESIQVLGTIPAGVH